MAKTTRWNSNTRIHAWKPLAEMTPEEHRKYKCIVQAASRKRNPEQQKRIQKRARAKYLAWMQDWIRYEKSKPCLDCKQSFPWFVMEFDHARGKKKFHIGAAPRGQAELLAERAKCDVVCANCHRKRTYERRQKQPHSEN